jgi:hypothetical protein
MAAHATPPTTSGTASHASPVTTAILAPHPAVAAQAVAVRAVTVLMGAVVALSFLFGFGNVWALGVRLGVPMYVAPLVAPAVDLSIVALLLGTRQLALRGASAAQVRPARRLLVFCSFVTLSLNVAEPLITGHYGRAAFDAVGPLLLIGLSDVGPGLLQAMNEPRGTACPLPAGQPRPAAGAVRPTATAETGRDSSSAGPAVVPEQRRAGGSRATGGRVPEGELLERARAEDARHRELHQRPISAEVLRKRLRVGAVRSRSLVAQLRAEHASATGLGCFTQGTSPASAAELT